MNSYSCQTGGLNTASNSNHIQQRELIWGMRGARSSKTAGMEMFPFLGGMIYAILGPDKINGTKFR